MAEGAGIPQKWVCVKSLFFQTFIAPPHPPHFKCLLVPAQLHPEPDSVADTFRAYESPNCLRSTHRLFQNGPLSGESLGDDLHLSTFHTVCIFS